MKKVFRVYCDGYSRVSESKEEIQEFIDGLRGKGCIGKTVEIGTGFSESKEGSGVAYVFPGNWASRRGVLQA